VICRILLCGCKSLHRPPKTGYFHRHFTEAYIRDLKSENNLQISGEAIPGLQIRYSSLTGRKVFYLNHRISFNYKQRNMKVGRYGDYTEAFQIVPIKKGSRRASHVFLVTF
jgi:hypothetical protein